MDLVQRIRRIPPVWLAVGVGLVVLLLARKASATARLRSLLTGKQLTAAQLANVDVIDEQFAAAGLPPIAAAAAVANAYAESKLNERAVGDGGNSVGLFQLHIKGVGHDMSVEERQDPATNTKAMLKRMVLASYGKNFRAAVKSGERVGELAAIFSRDCERPKDQDGEMAHRRALAETMFPDFA